jgi:predicted glycosyltransferase
LEQRAASSGVSFHAFLPCLPSLFDNIDALVCMGGYNTLVEAMSQGVPVVCVPRAVPRAEQLLRAQTMQKLRLLRTIHPKRLTVERLKDQIARTLTVARPALLDRCNQKLSFTGAQRAANYLLDLRGQLKRTPEGQLVPLRAR